MTATLVQAGAEETDALLYLREADVKALISPVEICQVVADLTWSDDLQLGFSADCQADHLSIGAKAGFIGHDAFGVKIRAGQEGRYLTAVWRGGGRLCGVVESAYLAYLRTAALMMVLPARHGVPVGRILVLGTGRLGSACCLIAEQLYVGAEVWVWSPSGGGPRVAWPGLDVASARFWQPGPNRDDAFDLVVTATRATEPLPLAGVSARYIGVGGACRPNRRELPQALVTSAVQLCSDAPALAPQVCGDLVGLAGQPIGSIRSFRETTPVPGSTIAFICGSGAIDAGLALAVCDRARSTQSGEHV
jgi:ornithine cyclodeaminase/alanine dehydrogenase-like protein (mu-crystallin family)